MNASLHDKARAAITEFGMFEPGDGVVVAVSGGADSLALLLVLHDLAPELDLRLVVGHLHHGLRGVEADADARFVGDVAGRLTLECVLKRTDVAALAREGGVGLEEAGREARYEFLQRLARRVGASKIAVGHTGSDVAETVLMNLLRGCGLEGMLGIPARSGNVVRPLIRAGRRETVALCRNRGVVPRTDPTNFDERFLRARVRHRILPVLEAELGGGVEQKVLEAVDLLRADSELLQQSATEALSRLKAREGPDTVELRLPEAAQLPAALLRRVVREALRGLQGDLRNIRRAHVEAVCALITSGATGAQAHLPTGLTAQRGYEALALGRLERAGSDGAWREPVALPVPGRVLVRAAGLWVEASLEAPPSGRPAGARWEAWLDFAYCRRNLRVRPWRAGDRFQPLGLRGTKKVHDFFIDEKVPRGDRARVPIVTRADGRVLWVVGHRMDERARLRDQTSAAVHLTARPAAASDQTNGGVDGRS